VNPSPEIRAWPSTILVFAAALALRLGHVLALRGSPYFARPVLDGETYYWAARALADGEGWAERVYWQPPGYPYFLAAILRVAGPGFLAPRLVQALLGALTAALTCAIGTRVFGRAVGIAAGFAVALYGVLIYYDGELLAPSLAICLQMATLYCAVRAPTERGGRGWLAAGLLGGLTAVVNAPALVLLPILAIAARRWAAWLLLGAAIAIAPVTLRNWTGGGELVLISSNAGINLYLGNNPRYDETVGMRPGRDWQALVRAPRLHGVSGAGPASRFFVARVTAYAVSDPAGFLGLQARKVRLLLGGTEIPRNQEIYPARAWSPVLRALLWKVPGLAFPFGLLLPLAVVGLGVAWRRAPVLAASVILLGLTVAAFFVTARYRAPLIPLLGVFAAAGVRWAAVEASGRARTIAGGVAVAAYLLANLGQGPMPRRMNPDAEQGLAHWLEREGRRPDALALYERLAREAPGSFDAWYGVAQLATALGQRAEAERALAVIRSLEPEFADTALLLARTALDAGCGAEADTFARRAVVLDPRSDLARTLLLQQAHALQTTRPGGPPGGCPPGVFVAPFPLAS
jgi:4-amino-4-deoxy-L-arabinose transferase-like glycosyltransferase